MNINPKMLNKMAPPAPGSKDPMLDEMDMGEGDEMGMGDDEGAESVSPPLGQASDEELMMEAAKRGLKISPSEEEELGAMDMGQEDA